MPRIKKPVHYRYYGGASESVCGLLGGTNGKGYRKVKLPKPNKYGHEYEYERVASDVSWSRVNVRLSRTTCAACLVKVMRALRKQLKARLKETNRTLLQELRDSRTQRILGGLRRLAG
jgi:hypothetical protein